MKTWAYQKLLTTRRFGELQALYNKVKTNRKINLIEKNVLVTSDEEIAETFKEYFDKTVTKLKIIQNDCYIRKAGNIQDPIKKASFKNRYHPSITNIKYIMKSKNIPSFSFQLVSRDKVKDIIKILNIVRMTIYL